MVVDNEDCVIVGLYDRRSDCEPKPQDWHRRIFCLLSHKSSIDENDVLDYGIIDHGTGDSCDTNERAWQAFITVLNTYNATFQALADYDGRP